MTTMPDFSGKTVLVTGASRGIGYHTALAFGEAGAHVIAIARTVGGLEELDDAIQSRGGSATLVPLDLKDFDGIDRLGGLIHERWGKLDVLFANAGILGGLSPLGHFDPKDWQNVMDINVTANWRLIRSMDRLLKQSDAGRTILMTSGAAHKCKAFWGAYSVSKAAVEALGKTYAAECTNSKVRVNLVNPGPMRTAMRALAMPGEDPDTLPHPEEIAPDILMLASGAMQEQGKIYDFASRRFLEPGIPGQGLNPR